MQRDYECLPKHGNGEGQPDVSAAELSELSQIPGLRFRLEVLTHSLRITSDFIFPAMPTMPPVLSYSLDHFCLE